ncbi:prepilin peptidase [Sphingomonas sp. 28-63-12]|uniref:A24 family peptidase n=1 Tax=Sphingomonas sp. 28-63-12 TaxID=1970434 RepID=UPI000BCC9D8C|nr:MAG: peptidase [Sphingomonas sp. 28-63-12]
MNWGYLVALMPALLALILVSAGIEDARLRTIANWKNALIAVLAMPWWWANGMTLWPDIAMQIGVATVIFGFFVGAFALGQMGGGDVKLIGALALWFPVQPMIWLLIMMSLIGGALTLLMMLDRWRRRDKAPLEIPYGVAIAIAGLLAVHEPVFNQFT